MKIRKKDAKNLVKEFLRKYPETPRSSRRVFHEIIDEISRVSELKHRAKQAHSALESLSIELEDKINDAMQYRREAQNSVRKMESLQSMIEASKQQLQTMQDLKEAQIILQASSDQKQQLMDELQKRLDEANADLHAKNEMIQALKDLSKTVQIASAAAAEEEVLIPPSSFIEPITEPRGPTVLRSRVETNIAPIQKPDDTTTQKLQLEIQRLSQQLAASDQLKHEIARLKDELKMFHNHPPPSLQIPANIPPPDTPKEGWKGFFEAVTGISNPLVDSPDNFIEAIHMYCDDLKMAAQALIPGGFNQIDRILWTRKQIRLYSNTWAGPLMNLMNQIKPLLTMESVAAQYKRWNDKIADVSAPITREIHSYSIMAGKKSRSIEFFQNKFPVEYTTFSDFEENTLLTLRKKNWESFVKGIYNGMVIAQSLIRPLNVSGVISAFFMISLPSVEDVISQFDKETTKKYKNSPDAKKNELIARGILAIMEHNPTFKDVIRDCNAAAPESTAHSVMLDWVRLVFAVKSQCPEEYILRLFMEDLDTTFTLKIDQDKDIPLVTLGNSSLAIKSIARVSDEGLRRRLTIFGDLHMKPDTLFQCLNTMFSHVAESYIEREASKMKPKDFVQKHLLVNVLPNFKEAKSHQLQDYYQIGVEQAFRLKGDDGVQAWESYVKKELQMPNMDPKAREGFYNMMQTLCMLPKFITDQGRMILDMEFLENEIFAAKEIASVNEFYAKRDPMRYPDKTKQYYDAEKTVKLLQGIFDTYNQATLCDPHRPTWKRGYDPNSPFCTYVNDMVSRPCDQLEVPPKLSANIDIKSVGQSLDLKFKKH